MANSIDGNNTIDTVHLFKFSKSYLASVLDEFISDAITGSSDVYVPVSVTPGDIVIIQGDANYWTAMSFENAGTNLMMNSKSSDYKATFIPEGKDTIYFKIPPAMYAAGKRLKYKIFKPSDLIPTSEKSSEQLTATVTPSNCTQLVMWSVSPEGIVTVDNGLVTAIANGEATVTATCGTQSATCNVIVSGLADNNILASTTFSNGTLLALNGSVEVDTSNYHSDYIEIADASHVNVTHTGTMEAGANRLVFYDNGKKYIKTQYNGALDVTSAIPANAKYMRIAFSNTVTSTSVNFFNFDGTANEYINDSVKLETHIDGTRYNEMTGAITSENGFYSMKITAPSDDNYYYLQNIASGASYNADGAFIPGTLLFANMDCIRLYKASKNISTIGINYSSSKTPSMKLVNDIVSSGYTETYLGVNN